MQQLLAEVGLEWAPHKQRGPCQCLRANASGTGGVLRAPMDSSGSLLGGVNANYQALQGQLFYEKCETPANGSQVCRGGNYAFKESSSCQGRGGAPRRSARSRAFHEHCTRRLRWMGRVGGRHFVISLCLS